MYNVITVVELLNNNRWVLVAMLYSEESPVKFAELQSSLIWLVHHLQQEHCPSLEVCEFLVSPNHIQQYPFDDLPDTKLFNMYHVARLILHHNPVVLGCKDGQGYIETRSIHFEPYYLLTPAHVCQLFNPILSDQPVPAPLLHEVGKICHQSRMKPQVNKELREYLDSLTGKNPLVSVCNMSVVVYLHLY